jgi:predicted RNase H-like HicB family nuclease
MSELLFNVTQEPDGGYVAVAVGESIATQGDTWEELCFMVLDATKAYFADAEAPPRIRLFLHVEQVLAVA